LTNVFEVNKLDKEPIYEANNKFDQNLHEENNVNALMGSTASTIGKQNYCFSKGIKSNSGPRDPDCLDTTEVKDKLEGIMLSNNSILEVLSDFRHKNCASN